MIAEPPDTPVFTLPETRKRGVGVRVALYALVSGLGIMAVLPLSQVLSGNPKDRLKVRSVEMSLPPPPPPPPEPPPPPKEEKQQQVKDVQEAPQDLTLSQLESSLNPGMGGALQGAFSLNALSIQGSVADQIKAFSISDLDRAPRPVRTPEPEWPQDVRLKGQPISVKLHIQIDPTGQVSVLRVLDSSDPDVTDAVRAAVSRWVFEPPTKDGKHVTAVYDLPIKKTFD